jgi:hypothetical protein
MRPIGGELEERIVGSRRVGEQQRALAEVIHGEAGQHDREPGKPDRWAAEMPHIGIHRLTARHRQEHGAEHAEAHVKGCVRQIAHGVKGIGGRQHLGVTHHACEAEHRDGAEPGQHHGPENPADERRSLALHVEQADQDHDRDRHDVMAETGRIHLEPLHGAQHRDCRRDGAVAIEQRGAHQAHHEDHRAQAPGRGFARIEQCKQRHDAALALVVGPQDQDRVFQRDDDHERPQDERQDPQDGGVRGGAARPGGPHGLLERVKRRGADIAIDDAERTKRCSRRYGAPSALRCAQDRP